MDTIGIFKHAPGATALPAGDVLFRDGDAASMMYAVVSGELSVLVKGVEVETVGEGGVVGEMGLINGQPRTATVVAKTDATVVPVGEAEFLRHVHNTPFFALQILRITAERLRRVNELIEGPAQSVGR